MTREPKPDTETRTYKAQVPMTQAERRKLHDMARAEGVTASQLIRDLLFRGGKK